MRTGESVATAVVEYEVLLYFGHRSVHCLGWYVLRACKYQPDGWVTFGDKKHTRSSNPRKTM